MRERPEPGRGFLLDQPWTAEDETRWRAARAAERVAERQDVEHEAERATFWRELNDTAAGRAPVPRATTMTAAEQATEAVIEAALPSTPGTARWYAELGYTVRER